MDLTPHVEQIRGQLAVAAEAGGEDARALAERLTAPLESAIRLTLLDALSAAADEITRELAPGSVELRLRAGEPEVVVTAAAARRARRPLLRAPGPAPGGAGGAAGAARRAPGRRARPGRAGDRPHQPAPARGPEGRHRAGGGARAAVGQRVARPRRRGGARRPRPRRRRPAAAARAGRPVVHRLGALSARHPIPNPEAPCPPMTRRARSPSRSRFRSATSGSSPASAPTPWSRSDRATRPTSRTFVRPSRRPSRSPTTA